MTNVLTPEAPTGTACSEPPGDDGEATLVARLRAGDPAAFDAVVRAHLPHLLAVARRLIRCEHEAADAVQDAMVSALRGIDRFDGRSRLSTWLHRVTVNAALMRARHNRRRPAARESDLDPDRLGPQFDQSGHHASPVPAWADAPEQAMTAETRRRVREAIDRLPAAYREVLVLRDIEEMDTEETAVLLRTTPGNVKTRLHRARIALRELLSAEMSELPTA